MYFDQQMGAPHTVRWSKSFFNAKTTFYGLFCSVSDGKSCFSIRKSISTSKRHGEHPFASQNTQQKGS